ncbi:hypothetical protein RYX36_015117, partial [Vicia faba]
MPLPISLNAAKPSNCSVNPSHSKAKVYAKSPKPVMLSCATVPSPTNASSDVSLGKRVRDLIIHVGRFSQKELELHGIMKPIVPFDIQFYYRNKMEFSFGPYKWLPKELLHEGNVDGGSENYALGLHVPGFFDKIINVDKCLLQTDLANKVLAAIQECWRDPQLGFSPYNVHSHVGFLKHLMLRSGKYLRISKSPSPSPWKAQSRSRSRSRSRSVPRQRPRSDSRGRGRAANPTNPGNTLYVTSLSSRVTERDLEDHFSKEGKVASCFLVVEPRTRISRGFAFVTMDSHEDAERCIKHLNQSVLEGRYVTLERSRRKRARTPTPGHYLGLKNTRDYAQTRGMLVDLGEMWLACIVSICEQ